MQDFKAVNGFSNRYFGWGQEDDDMYERLRFVFKDVKHIDEKIGKYHAMDHGRVKDLDVTDVFKNNTLYLASLRNKGPEIFKADGFDQIQTVSVLKHVWTGGSGPSLTNQGIAVVPEGMGVVSGADYDHILVDALDPKTLKPFPPCASAFDLHLVV
jgi:hypothetical protein